MAPRLSGGPTREAARARGRTRDPSSSRPSGAAASVRLLRAQGFTESEATSLAALAVGLAPVRSGWTLAEVNGLSFQRWLVDHGRVRA